MIHPSGLVNLCRSDWIPLPNPGGKPRWLLRQWCPEGTYSAGDCPECPFEHVNLWGLNKLTNYVVVAHWHDGMTPVSWALQACAAARALEVLPAAVATEAV